MGKTNKDIKSTTLSSPKVILDKQENVESKETRYVVVRDGYRVSPNEYVSPNDIAAQIELQFWAQVETNHSWGAPVNIVPHDNRLHRIW